VNVLFDQQPDPEKRKKDNEKDRENDPAGGGDPSFGFRQELAHAARAPVVRVHELRASGCQRCSPESGLCRKLDVLLGKRLVDAGSLAWVCFGLEFVGLPRIGTRRLVLVLLRRNELLRLLLLLRHGVCLHEFRTAKTAKLAFRRIDLSAILALVHMDRDGSIHAVLNE